METVKCVQDKTPMRIENKCRECDGILSGRSDKKFCGILCRNTYYNRLNTAPTDNIYRINRLLLKNRRILEGVIRSDTKKIPKGRLEQDGFTFKYYTNTAPTKSGTYVFCYDYGYLPLENDYYLVVKNREA